MSIGHNLEITFSQRVQYKKAAAYIFIMSSFIKHVINTKKSQVSFCLFIILCTGLIVGLHNVTDTGIQWLEDGARYCNNGAMLRDYLVSGELLNPYQFAQKNYTQYPAFSVPYHPPGYALLLGIWFLIFGMKYEIARSFIAFLLGLTGCFFFSILRRQGVTTRHALIASLLFITSYEMSRWGRSTLSEIPGILFLMVGTYCFLRWVDTELKKWCWLAFLFAFFAFFCRIPSVGIIPAWILYYVSVKGIRKSFSVTIVATSTIFLSCAVVWTKFVSQFATYEIRASATDRLYTFATWDNFFVWLKGLPDMVGVIAIIAAFIGIILAWQNNNKKFVKFWVLWFLSYYVFWVLNSVPTGVLTSYYFLYSVPAIFALAIVVLQYEKSSCWLKSMIIIVFVFMLCNNIFHIINMTNGLTGHNIGAEQLTKLKQPGNILLSCWNESDLIFRYRCHDQKFSRQMIRGDRTLAIRLSPYAGIPAKELSKNMDDVIGVIKQGRIRYILTSSPKSSGKDTRPKDMILAHKTVTLNPDLFTLIDKYKLHYGFRKKNPRNADVFIWRFEGELKPGKSQLPVIIPTAGITINNNS